MTFPALALCALVCAACSDSAPPSANAPAAAVTPASTPARASTPTSTPAPEILTATAQEARVAPGGEAVVRLDIAEGWHVNANPPSDKFYIGVEVQAEPADGVAPGKPVYPRAQMRKFEFAPQPLAVYEGSVSVRLPLRAEPSAAKGTRSLRARVRYQPCNDRECLPPRTAEIAIPVNVG